jgi:hypothetical protein
LTTNQVVTPQEGVANFQVEVTARALEGLPELAKVGYLRVEERCQWEANQSEGAAEYLRKFRFFLLVHPLISLELELDLGMVSTVEATVTECFRSCADSSVNVLVLRGLDWGRDCTVRQQSVSSRGCILSTLRSRGLQRSCSLRTGVLSQRRRSLKHDLLTVGTTYRLINTKILLKMGFFLFHPRKQYLSSQLWLWMSAQELSCCTWQCRKRWRRWV